jgi:tRNA dimethylallyltransferase
LTDVSADADVRVICGPTAAGKSAVALWLAEREPTTIISADSRQVYRGFDIGTAKPTAHERARVPHLGIDIAQPIERFSAAAWAERASSWIEAARREGREPLIVGGTGLYLRALFEGLFDEPPLDAASRRGLERVLATFDVHELRRWTIALDPDRGHLGRTQLLRAIEIALLTGRRMSELHRERTKPARWRARYLLVDPGPSLADRIAARLDGMFDNGWPREVERLMTTVPATAPAWNATGYDTLRRMELGELSASAARGAVLIQTRQYAKRQRTWFRHQLPEDAVTRLDPTVPTWQSEVAAWSDSSRQTRGSVA